MHTYYCSLHLSSNLGVDIPILLKLSKKPTDRDGRIESFFGYKRERTESESERINFFF